MKKLYISPLLILILCISAYFGAGRIVALVIAAAVLHEAGHILTLVIQKKKIRRIALGLCGAVIESDCQTYKQEIICACAGPIVNAALSLLYSIAPVFAAINFMLMMYNILPIYPLDGGRILRGVLLLNAEETTVYKIVHWTNIVCCALLMVLSVFASVVYSWGLFPVFLTAAVLFKTGMMAAKDGY